MPHIHMILISFLTLFLTSTSLQADYKPWGLGVMISNPTGLSAKHRFSETRSLDAGLGYSLGRNQSLSLHSTYLWEFNDSLRLGRIAIGHYFGVGGSVHSRESSSSNPRWARSYPGEDFGLSARGVAGLNYYFQDPSVEVFTEAAYHFFVLPGTYGHIGLALGGRYFF